MKYLATDSVKFRFGTANANNQGQILKVPHKLGDSSSFRLAANAAICGAPSRRQSNHYAALALPTTSGSRVLDSGATRMR
jgi:hypothetical protein